MKLKFILEIEVDEEQCKEYIEDNKDDFPNSQTIPSVAKAYILSTLNSNFDYDATGMRVNLIFIETKKVLGYHKE